MKFLIPVLCFCLAGCSSGNFGRPKVPGLFTSAAFLYTDEEFSRDYAAYKSTIVVCADPTPPRECMAKNLRDSIINRIAVDIELNYREYISELYFGRAGTNVGLDALELGLAMGATVAGAEGTKTVLAAILSAVKGTRLSFDKHIFMEKTTPIIIARMEILRESVETDIQRKMSLSVSQYPLEEAWVDLVDLFYSGTLQAGIQALSSDTGTALVEMRKQRALRIQERFKK